ncbi:MAG: DUF58 domain-containing protein [Treponema sp.]|nr:DUF58 domain-containing protein [Candidatus Treponema equi]
MKNNTAQRAQLLHLTSLSLANGMKNGSFRSLYRGQGIEFSGVREYLRGDDVRAIDWNVTARMCKPYVKVFEEERELDVFVVVDKSLSMNTGSGIQSRLETAMDCASLLTMASLHNGSPVGSVVFDGKIEFSCAPKAGRNQALLLLSEFDKHDNQVVGSALESALRGAEKLLRKRTLVFVISDFRAAGWSAPFSHLCQKNDVIAIKISDPLDDILPSLGAVPFRDPETGFECVLPTSSQKFSRAWREDAEKRNEQWKKECLRNGGIPMTISTMQDPAAELIKFFSTREQYSV